MIKNVIKRNGDVVPFDHLKIYNAIMKAMKYGSGIINEDIAYYVSENAKFHFENDVTIYEIEDYVFEELLEVGEVLTAKAYTEYKAVQTYKRNENTSDEAIMGLIRGTNKEVITENSNKNAKTASTMRDLIAGEVSKDLSKRFLIPSHIIQAHNEGIIHWHDMDYTLQPIPNCFSGDTEFITNYGVKKFNECFDGQEVEVVDKNGKWRKATVRNYGKQDLYKITLQSGRTIKEIKATLNHRWLLKDGTVTTNLKIEDRLYLLNEIEIEELNDDMFCLGFVLGDGSDHFAGNSSTEGVRLRLCGEKKSYLNKFIKCGYKISKQRFENDDIEVYKNGFAYNKAFIDNKMWKILSKKDKVSLFIGYYSADGSKDRYGLSTSNKNLAEMIREISALAGYYITSEKYVIRNTNYKENAELYSFRFMKYQPSNSNWVVKNIEKYTQHKYDVWCVEEPITKTFTLNNGVVTGNCCLVNLKDMLDNGTAINGTMVESPNSFMTACTIATQIMAQIASGQYGLN